MKITNPEKECKVTPDLTEESKIISVDTSIRERGIIFDSPEELVQGLVAYNRGVASGSGATQKNIIDSLGGRGNGMAGAAMLFVGASNEEPFMKRLEGQVLSGLKSEGRFYGSYDYEAMGTNFMQTSLFCRELDNKYILEISAAFVGTIPEQNLAAALEKPRALVSASAVGKLSTVDDWWFNINIKQVLAGIPIAKGKLSDITKYLIGKKDRPDLKFKHKGKKYSLNIALDADRYLARGERGSEYMTLRGDNIVGGAWTTWAEDGNTRVPPRAINPAIVLSVSSEGDIYRSAVVNDDDKQSVMSARNYIFECLRAN